MVIIYHTVPQMLESTYLYLGMLAESLRSCPTLVTLWTVAHQASLSMGFSRQECWSGLPCPSQGIFLIQGFNLHLLIFYIGG